MENHINKAFITGITGTVAPHLKEELVNNGYIVYDKHIRINKDGDLIKLKEYLDKINPDYIFHLALGPISYVETLVNYANENDKILVYISTVSVFEDNDGGPYYKETQVKVKNEYGKYKYACEKRIIGNHSDKGDPTSNNMFNFIVNNLNEAKEITASDMFYPSTSFLSQTVKAIIDITENNGPDLYLVNSNRGKSLFDIVNILNANYNLNIKVIKDSSLNRNDIMFDDRVIIEEIDTDIKHKFS